MTAGAAEVVQKLKAHAERRRSWEPELIFAAELAAFTLLQAAREEDAAVAAGRRPESGEARSLAREELVEWGIVPAGAVHLTPLDEQGRDADLRRFLKGRGV